MNMQPVKMVEEIIPVAVRVVIKEMGLSVKISMNVLVTSWTIAMNMQPVQMVEGIIPAAVRVGIKEMGPFVKVTYLSDILPTLEI